jgi:hypothetical protein
VLASSGADPSIQGPSGRKVSLRAAGRGVRSQRFDIAFFGLIRDGLLFAGHVPDPTAFQIGIWEAGSDPEPLK